MRVEQFSKRDYVELRVRVAQALSKFVWETYDARALALYQRAPRAERLWFLAMNPDIGGIIEFEPGESIVDPKLFAEEYRFQEIMIFPENLSWIMQTGHEDWDPIAFGTPHEPTE